MKTHYHFMEMSFYSVRIEVFDFSKSFSNILGCLAKLISTFK